MSAKFSSSIIVPSDQYRVLCVAGYHEAEEQFGSDVIQSFKNQFTEKPNVFFHEVIDNEGSVGGKPCERVDREIGARTSSLKPDLIVDIHHQRGFYNQIAELVNASKLKVGQVTWGLPMPVSLRSPSDYVWYCRYLCSQKDAFRLLDVLPRDYYDQYNFTRIQIEAGLKSDSPLLKSFEKASSYDIEVDKFATHINDIIDSYRLFRHRLSGDEKFRGKVKEEAKRWEEKRKEIKFIPWEDAMKELPLIEEDS